MKTKIFFTISIFLVLNLNAQYSWQWAITEGSVVNEYITAIACDADGNIYASGVFRDTLNFFGETLISQGGNDVFVACFNPNGNLIWVRQGGGMYEDFPRDICVKNNYVYVTGGFNEQATFEGETLVSIGVRDVFLLKYNTDGTLLWATSGGSVTDDSGYSVTVDETGNVFIVGDINYAATFDEHNVNYYGFTDIFMAAYDENGICQWANSAGGPIYDYGSSIEVKGNHLFIGGSFNDVAVFDTATISVVEFADIFIAHYLTDGSFVEVFSAGGSSNENLISLALDSDMNVYVTGWFLQDMTIGNTTLNSNGSNDIFLTKFEPGVGFAWSQSFGGPGIDEGLSLFYDAEDKFIFTGTFENEISLGATQLISDGFDDGFMGRFDGNGNFDWVFQAGGSGSITVHTCTADLDLNYYFAGDFVEELIIGNSVFTPVGNYDLFIAKLGEGVNINETISQQVLNILPNPFTTSTTIEYELANPSTVQLTIYDYLGNQVEAIEQNQSQGKQQIVWNAERFPAGIYFCKIQAGNVTQTIKIIKL